MAEYDDRTSIPTLIRGLVDDARELIREELQLARSEIRESERGRLVPADR